MWPYTSHCAGITTPRVSSCHVMASALLLECFVARLRLGVRGIEARQRHAAADLAHDPAFETFLLDGEGRDLVDHRRGNDDGSVAIGDDHIVREHRDAAATDWLLP